jgi:hypothetical protein
VRPTAGVDRDAEAVVMFASAEVGAVGGGAAAGGELGEESLPARLPGWRSAGAAAQFWKARAVGKFAELVLPVT